MRNLKKRKEGYLFLYHYDLGKEGSHFHILTHENTNRSLLGYYYSKDWDLYDDECGDYEQCEYFQISILFVVFTFRFNLRKK